MSLTRDDHGLTPHDKNNLQWTKLFQFQYFPPVDCEGELVDEDEREEEYCTSKYSARSLIYPCVVAGSRHNCLTNLQHGDKEEANRHGCYYNG